MQTKSNNTSTSTILILILVIITFPLWIGLLGGMFGLVIGLLGGFIGLIGGLVGGIAGMIGSLFGWIFDSHFHFGVDFWNVKFFVILAIVLAIIFVSRSRRI